MESKAFHPPTENELAFLRIVARGYEALERQIESCEISEYDLHGYYDVRILEGPSMQAERPYHPIDGPILDISDPDAPQPATTNLAEPNIDTILWTDERGFLCSVEVCSIGDGYIVDPCSAYVEAYNATPNRLKFRSPGHPALD